jgi:hypothetical protein
MNRTLNGTIPVIAASSGNATARIAMNNQRPPPGGVLDKFSRCLRR